jgi:transposase
MKAEERIAQLESENAALRAENAALREERALFVQQMEHLLARLQEVEGRLAKDSHNSSKPPSSDGPSRKRRSRRAKSGKKTGGQPGHEGRTLLPVAKPDEIVPHRPARCMHCQQSLEAVAGQVQERRQVHDLPAVRLVVQEHQVEEVYCPACGHLNAGSFPTGVEAPVQYGPNVQALGVYLHQYQLVPLGRSCEVLADLYNCHVSEATLVSWVQIASTSLEATVERIAQRLRVGRRLAWG